MPIHERKAARAIVKAGGHVNDLRRAWFVRAVTLIGKGSVVNTDRMFIDEDPRLGRGHDDRLLVVGAPGAGGEPKASAEHLAHRNAPDPGHALAFVILDHGFVRRTFVNPTAVAGVGPEGTPDNIVGNVPVHARAGKVQPARTPVASSRREAVLGSQEDVVAVIGL